MSDAEGFDAFASERWRQLMRAGWLLTGDWASAEDLVQATLERVWVTWPRALRADSPQAYVRRMLTNQFLGEQRRRSASELPASSVPEVITDDLTDVAGRRLTLIAALNTLPALQRAAVVLRYFEDLSVEQTAAALGCSVGNVKSQTSRALRKLRTSPYLDDAMKECT